MRKLIYIVFITFLISNNLTYSQSIYLKKGEIGFLLGAGYHSSNKNYSAVWVGVGYSVYRIFDIGLSLGRGTGQYKTTRTYYDPYYGYHSYEYEYDRKAISLFPFVDIFILKQTEIIPFSLSIGAGYEKAFISGDDLDERDAKASAYGYGCNASIYKLISASTRLNLIPSAGITYFHTKYTEKQKYYSDYSEDDNITSFNLSLSIDFKLQSNDIFIIVPGVSVDKDNTTLGISIRFVFPVKKKN
jgi:hypothetical protein